MPSQGDNGNFKRSKQHVIRDYTALTDKRKVTIDWDICVLLYYTHVEMYAGEEARIVAERDRMDIEWTGQYGCGNKLLAIFILAIN